MPVSVESAISGPFTPNGVTVTFPFTFKAASAAEVIVVDEDGAALSSALYTVTVDDDEGGSVTFSTAPSAAQYDELYIVSDPLMTQSADFGNAGPSFNPRSLTSAIDKAAVRDLALNMKLDRTLQVPFGEDGLSLPSAADRTGKYLAFDVDGDPVASSGTGADAGLREDLAAVGGAALIRVDWGGSVQDALNGLGIYLPSMSGFTFDTDSPVANGTANKAAFDEAINILSGEGGGTLILPRGFYFAPSTVPMLTDVPIEIRGQSTYRAAQIWPNNPGDIDEWLLEFTDSSGTVTGNVSIRNLVVKPYGAAPAWADRPAISGIKVGNTNHTNIENVYTQFLKGHGFWGKRIFNGVAGVYSFRCGGGAYWGQTYTGAGTDDLVEAAPVGNDIILTGNTEWDGNGIRIHHAAHVRGYGIKFHGSENTERLLEVYRSANVDIHGYLTRGWGADGAVYVGDDTGVEQPTEAESVSYPIPYVSGRLRLDLFSNFVNFGAAGAAVYLHDAGGAGLMEYQGQIPRLSTLLPDDTPLDATDNPVANSSVLMRLTAVTGTANNVDISGWVRRGDDLLSLIVDERTLNRNLMIQNGSSVTGIQLPLRTVFPGNSGYQQRLGEMSLYSMASIADETPELRVLAAHFAHNSLGTPVVIFKEDLPFSGWGAISVDTVLSYRGLTFPTPPDGAAYRKRTVGVVVYAEDVPAAWTDADGWRIRVWRSSTANDYIDYKLSRDILHSTPTTGGAGYPDIVAAKYDGHEFKFWSTIPANSYYEEGTTLKIELVKGASAAAITNVDGHLEITSELYTAVSYTDMLTEMSGSTRSGMWDFTDLGAMFTDDGITPAALTDEVYRVNDLSSNNNHMRQTDAARRPVITADGLYFSSDSGANAETIGYDFVTGAGPSACTIVMRVTKDASDTLGSMFSDGTVTRSAGTYADASASAISSGAGTWYVDGVAVADRNELHDALDDGLPHTFMGTGVALSTWPSFHLSFINSPAVMTVRRLVFVREADVSDIAQFRIDAAAWVAA